MSKIGETASEYVQSYVELIQMILVDFIENEKVFDRRTRVLIVGRVVGFLHMQYSAELQNEIQGLITKLEETKE
jgi:hypothetical protein